MTTLTWDNVRAWRLQQHQLLEPAPAKQFLDVVERIAGLHAQVASSAELTLWARIKDLDKTTVQNALEDSRDLIKTWSMRGTLHLLPAREFAVWQNAQRTRTHYRKPVWFRAFGVDNDELDTIIASVRKALHKGMLTREQLATKVGNQAGEHLGEKLRESWGALLKPAAFEGALAFGPSDGQRVRFVRPDQWLDQTDLLAHDPAEALDEVITRYLAASGPSTREELARWWGHQPADAGRVLKGLGDTVQEVDVEGTKTYALTDQLTAISKAKPPKGHVKLLPAFDQYVITATKQVEHFTPADVGDRIYRKQGWLSAVVLVDGRMDGIWKHEIKGNAVEVSVEPFVPFSAKTRKAVEREAERLSGYLDKTLRLDWTD
ncbi:winged helix DNA-binding domain-containing protein [Tenggerimyces flavus]|uniref:Winged helix DNA-binding domain-containing protein n=1 Tax=Tenggerimyces flavus TaxID=1708749 RepID=A0ABV7Y4D3_9ACTN|nr:winged helix DNA-binding domain-containing protein [Tenggerimyces flavus]MBM7790521.1 uncharacterized protein YcaQ [Tenggerimyces flavus]